MKLVEALNFLINDLLPATTLPSWFLAPLFMTGTVRHTGTSKQRFKVLAKEILVDERQQAATQPIARGGLMSTVFALPYAVKDHSGSLTEEQINGKLLLVTVAGYETTATNIGYGTTLLAAEPKWQDWLYARSRLMANMQDSQSKSALGMSRPREARLRFVRRYCNGQ